MINVDDITEYVCLYSFNFCDNNACHIAGTLNDKFGKTSTRYFFARRLTVDDNLKDIEKSLCMDNIDKMVKKCVFEDKLDLVHTLNGKPVKHILLVSPNEHVKEIQMQKRIDDKYSKEYYEGPSEYKYKENHYYTTRLYEIGTYFGLPITILSNIAKQSYKQILNICNTYDNYRELALQSLTFEKFKSMNLEDIVYNYVCKYVSLDELTRFNKKVIEEYDHIEFFSSDKCTVDVMRKMFAIHMTENGTIYKNDKIQLVYNPLYEGSLYHIITIDHIAIFKLKCEYHDRKEYSIIALHKTSYDDMFFIQVKRRKYTTDINETMHYIKMVIEIFWRNEIDTIFISLTDDGYGYTRPYKKANIAYNLIKKDKKNIKYYELHDDDEKIVEYLWENPNIITYDGEKHLNLEKCPYYWIKEVHAYCSNNKDYIIMKKFESVSFKDIINYDNGDTMLSNIFNVLQQYYKEFGLNMLNVNLQLDIDNCYIWSMCGMEQIITRETKNSDWEIKKQIYKKIENHLIEFKN
jgi:hypothetical protein